MPGVSTPTQSDFGMPITPHLGRAGCRAKSKNVVQILRGSTSGGGRTRLSVGDRVKKCGSFKSALVSFQNHINPDDFGTDVLEAKNVLVMDTG